MELFRVIKKIGLVPMLYKLKNRVFNRDQKLLALCDQNGAYGYLKRYRYVLDMATPIYEGENQLPNKIWVLWLQGYDNAPTIVQRCIDSIKEYANGREVVMLDENNFRNFVDIPDYIDEKFKKGIIPFAHFSDYIRLALLAKYGGTWIDSTTYLTNDLPDYITSAALFFYQHKQGGSSPSANWFISTNTRNNPIILQLKKCHEVYWQKENRLIAYSIFGHFLMLTIQSSEYNQAMWKRIPYFDDINCKVLQNELFDTFSEERFEQIKQMSSVHKLTYKFTKEQAALRDTFYQKIIQK